MDPDYWNGYLYGLGDTFSKKLNNSGTFYYTDQVGGKNGQINVISPTTPTIALESPRIEGSQFLFEATGLTVGKTNVLLFSTNLSTWTALTTNLTVSTSVTFTNIVSAQGYFRAVELP